jgi:hypothetical protein
MNERRTVRKIQKALREHDCVGIVRQMHFGLAFYVVGEEDVCATPCQRRPRSGEITSTIYEEWYDMVPNVGDATLIYIQGHYGNFPLATVLRRLKERRLAD